MGKPVVHFEIEGRDGRALQAFYSQLFEWKFMPAPANPAYGLAGRSPGPVIPDDVQVRVLPGADLGIGDIGLACLIDIDSALG